MKAVTTISRILLGLTFTVFGLNGFLNLIPMSPPVGAAGQFMGLLFTTRYLVPVFVLETGRRCVALGESLYATLVGHSGADSS